MVLIVEGGVNPTLQGLLNAMTDISFREPEWLLGSKFSTSGSGPHERVPYQAAPLHLREARNRQPMWRGGGGMRSRSVRNASKRWARPRKIWREGSLGLEALQPLEIPQNGQSFLWKCLEKTSLDLEKLAKKPWRRP